MNYETITVRPLAGALGAEIAGVDLRQPLSNRQWSEVHQAFLDYCAIYIRDQELGGADMLRYARYFAEPAFYPFVEGMPEFPQIFELRKEPDHDGECRRRLALRHDLSRQAADRHDALRPRGAGLWRRHDGGQPVPRLRGAVAGHAGRCSTASPASTARGMNGGRGGRAENKYMKMKDTVAKADEVEAEHPVVRTHPETGRKALYVSTRHTIRFKGMTEEESRPLLEFLQAHCTRPEFTARIRWEKGTITIWDNRCVQHFAINDYQGQRRVMWRLPVGAEAVV